MAKSLLYWQTLLGAALNCAGTESDVATAVGSVVDQAHQDGINLEKLVDGMDYFEREHLWTALAHRKALRK